MLFFESFRIFNWTFDVNIFHLHFCDTVEMFRTFFHREDPNIYKRLFVALLGKQ